MITSITKYEKCYTITEQETSLASKLTFCMFFNSAIQNFMISVIIPWKLGSFKDAKLKIIQEGGLITNQHQVLISNVIVTNLMNLIDTPYLMWKYYYRENATINGKYVLTQA